MTPERLAWLREQRVAYPTAALNLHVDELFAEIDACYEMIRLQRRSPYGSRPQQDAFLRERGLPPRRERLPAGPLDAAKWWCLDCDISNQPTAWAHDHAERTEHRVVWEPTWKFWERR
jgi:hypothetical protein